MSITAMNFNSLHQLTKLTVDSMIQAVKQHMPKMRQPAADHNLTMLMSEFDYRLRKNTVEVKAALAVNYRHVFTYRGYALYANVHGVTVMIEPQTWQYVHVSGGILVLSDLTSARHFIDACIEAGRDELVYQRQ